MPGFSFPNSQIELLITPPILIILCHRGNHKLILSRNLRKLFFLVGSVVVGQMLIQAPNFIRSVARGYVGIQVGGGQSVENSMSQKLVRSESEVSQK